MQQDYQHLIVLAKMDIMMMDKILNVKYANFLVIIVLTNQFACLVQLQKIELDHLRMHAYQMHIWIIKTVLNVILNVVIVKIHLTTA